MQSPYKNRALETFWRSGVSSKTISTLNNIYKPKFEIKKSEKVVTLGSCFAQHIARNMRAKGYTVVDTEPPPPGLKGIEANRFGYELFSCRAGNIYVMRQLLQLYQEANDLWTPTQKVWEKNGRYYDAMRPSVEPNGLDKPECVVEHRERHLLAVKKMFSEADVIVFTLGLTECWMHRTSGDIYPTAPGTIAGSYSDEDYVFKNFTATEIYDDFVKFMNYLTSSNKDLKFLLTVSPVPLTATATDNHVLVATTYSKSVLRTVAGQLVQDFDCVDYFPSYDIITSTLAGGTLYQQNLRSVTPAGVGIAMNTFFYAQGDSEQHIEEKGIADEIEGSDIEDEFCEDVLLEAFGK
jgi:hypothetical protein